MQAPEVGELLEPLLPALGDLLSQMAEAQPPFGLPPQEAEALEERLCFCLGVLAERWLIHLAPHAAPPFLHALWSYSMARGLPQWRRCAPGLSPSSEPKP